LDDDEAFYERYVEPLEERMLRAVRRVVRDPDLARDALQDAVVRLWQHRERLRGHPNPEALAVRVCFHSAIDAARRAGRRRETSGVDLEGRPGPGRGRGPSDALEQDELREAVVRAIAALPRQQALAVLMRVVEEQPYAVVARALGCAEITARIHVMRGRSRLRRVLAPFGSERGRAGGVA
jgi:RNA polymerase sigma factor (sigma-70 family)